ncbi:MAG: hypothetical protein JWL69_183 [Phycisphaerales bacterium]|nr:hypothetical protein [Phycisphaerales bacterium]
MKSICMYTPSAKGGHARYTMELLTALSVHARGYRVELVTSKDLEDQFRAVPYPVHAILPPLAHRDSFTTPAGWVANRLSHYPRREYEFLRWLRTRPDIDGVHFQEWTSWLAGPLFRRIRAMGKKIFYTSHNVVPHKYPRLVPKAVMNGWIRRAARQANGLFVHTDLLAGELSRFLGEPHPPINVVNHGVWTVNDHVKGPAMDERLSWKRLLFFGAIRRNKGLDLLLRAAEYLPGYSITIAGEAADAEYFRDEILPLVRRLQQGGMKVDLQHRFIPDAQVGTLFATHSAIVLPYTRGFVAQSGVAFMALAYELPMIASEAGGLRELFNQFKIGTTFRDQTPQALAGAVKALYTEDSRQELEREISAAKERFSWAQAARATAAGYARADEKVTESNASPVRTTAAL